VRFTVTALPPRAVMGVVNVTPDSFSDGGRFLDAAAAIDHGRVLAAAGAAVLDVGGESTRPGAEPVSVDVELARVVPVVTALAASVDVVISVDTTKAAVAAAALDAGAVLVNDVSAGRNDTDMFGVVAARDAGIVLMHMRGEPRTMQDAPHYDDVVGEVAEFLAARVDAAVHAGVRRDAVLADPGIGFGKTARHNLTLLGVLDRLAAAVAVPLLVGTSRKSFLGAFGAAATPFERDDATLATTVWAFTHDAAMVRVHDVAASVRAARLLDVMDRATPDGILVEAT
jgi:dihydropteroate synthase